MDVVIACGGIGLPPLRGAIYHIIRNREKYGKVTLLYGARTPKDLMYPNEYEAWQKADIDVQVTVDRGDETWTGRVGVVPMWFYHFRVDPHKTAVLTCGPEIMIRFVIYEALARRIPADRIFVSLERNMKCGQGSCGHCQMGPYFICKDGPVFPFKRTGTILQRGGVLMTLTPKTNQAKSGRLQILLLRRLPALAAQPGRRTARPGRRGGYRLFPRSHPRGQTRPVRHRPRRRLDHHPARSRADQGSPRRSANS